MPPSTSPVVVASHPRSGTHLLIDVLRHQFEACRSWKWWGERLDRLYCNIDELNARDQLLSLDTAQTILERVPRPIIKTHAWPGFSQMFMEKHNALLPASWTSWVETSATFLYVYRDVHDVMSSYYIFRKQFDDATPDQLGTFIRQHDPIASCNRIQRWAEHLSAWSRTPDVHEFRFESLLDDPEANIKRLSRVLEMEPDWRRPLLPRPFSSIWDSRRARLFSRYPESTSIIGPTSIDWRIHLDDADRSFI